MADALLLTLKFTGICFIIVFLFTFVFLPIFCAVFHDGVSGCLQIKVGANGKKNCSLYSQEYSVEMIESILKEDPRFSDILMYRMNIESAKRQIRIAKRKKKEYTIKMLKQQIYSSSVQLENSMKMYIQENPSEYNNITI